MSSLNLFTPGLVSKQLRSLIQGISVSVLLALQYLSYNTQFFLCRSLFHDGMRRNNFIQLLYTRNGELYITAHDARERSPSNVRGRVSVYICV